MNGIAFAGRYEGSGVWYDEAGKSQAYTVVQTNTATSDGFEVAFKHDFADDTVVEARFVMRRIGPFLLRVDGAGKPLGNGYCFEDYCHYHIAADHAVVEVSLRASGDALEVYGSSTKNAEGLYIAWRESLRRAAPAG
jgi:hypothetical protein